MKRHALAVGLFSLAVAASAFIGPKTAPAHRDEMAGLTFPKTLGGFAYVSLHHYGSAALGYSLCYKLENMAKADVYVYTKDIADIPSGISNAVVKTENRTLRMELDLMQQHGDYQNLTPLDSGVKAASERIAFLWGRYSFTASGHAVVSETFLTGYANRFIKVRLTGKAEHAAAVRAATDAFIEALAAALEAETEPGVLAQAIPPSRG